MINKHATQTLMVGILMGCSLVAWGAEEPKKDGAPPEVHYYDLDPNIITNYQKPAARRLGFITIDVQFQVNSEQSLDLLEQHKPLVEATLIDVINSFDEELIKSLERRDEIREKIRERLAAVLKEETGKEVVQNVLFTKFIFQ